MTTTPTGKIKSVGKNAKSPPHMPSDVTPDVSVFDRFAKVAAGFFSKPWFFAMCVLLVLVWAPSYFVIQDVNTWQLIINTATTIVTFLMVFLIQSTQSRDTQALHLKLDELIRVDNAARNSLLNLEEMSEADIEQVKTTFRRLIGPSEAIAVREAV